MEILWTGRWCCLLYTSDAADEEDSVDLGGRRIIKKNSIFKKFSINATLDNSYNYNSTKVKSYSNSIFENFLLSLGPNLIKNEIHCNLLENYASCFVNGVMLLNGDQHHELKTNVNHKHENCKSSQLIKSVLLGKSNGTYQGKIYVNDSAQKTNGYQLSKALILSDKSEFNSKPELEIYADDAVSYTHLTLPTKRIV